MSNNREYLEYLAYGEGAIDELPEPTSVNGELLKQICINTAGGGGTMDDLPEPTSINGQLLKQICINTAGGGGGSNPIDIAKSSLASGTVVGWYDIPHIITGGAYIDPQGNIIDKDNPSEQYTKGGVLSAENMIACLPNERYRWKGVGVWNGAPSGVTFINGNVIGYDRDKRFKQVILNNASRSDYVEFTIPDGVYYLNLFVFDGSPRGLQKYGKHYVQTQADKSLLDQLLVLEQTKQRNFTKPRIKKPQRGAVTLVVDDMNYGAADVAEACAKRGLKLCFANYGDFNTTVAPSSKPYAQYFTKYMTKGELMHRGEAFGFEMLQHEGRVITADNIDNWDVLYDQFAGAKAKSQFFGFDPIAYILAGGTGYISKDLRTDKWVRYYFKMSDLYGAPYEGESSEDFPTTWTGNPYLYRRVALSNYNTDDDLQALCDKLSNDIAAGKWTILYTHGSNDFDPTRFETLLDYIVDNDLPVMTYKEIYDTCFTMDGVDDKQLVSISATASTTTFASVDDVTVEALGLSVVATYDDGSTESVVSGYAVDLGVIVVGQNTISVSYRGKSVNISITVEGSPEPVPTEWSVTFTGTYNYKMVSLPLIDAVNGEKIRITGQVKVEDSGASSVRTNIVTRVGSTSTNRTDITVNVPSTDWQEFSKDIILAQDISATSDTQVYVNSGTGFPWTVKFRNFEVYKVE